MHLSGPISDAIHTIQGGTARRSFQSEAIAHTGSFSQFQICRYGELVMDF
jgi:hypothetical protein